jgi:hypothetical protein
MRTLTTAFLLLLAAAAIAQAPTPLETAYQHAHTRYARQVAVDVDEFAAMATAAGADLTALASSPGAFEWRARIDQPMAAAWRELPAAARHELQGPKCRGARRAQLVREQKERRARARRP